MNKRFILLLTVLAMAVGGCSQIGNPIEGNAIIDWMDFVKLNGKTYVGLHHHVIRDPDLVTDQTVGTVKFKLDGVVTNPHYRPQNGDAAYLAEGTRLYGVEGFGPDEVIAARDEGKIGGFRLYAEEKFSRTIPQRYPDMPKQQVERIRLFKDREMQPFRTLTGEEVRRFIALLDGGEDKTGFVPDRTGGDPDVYMMVFCTDGPLAYAYDLWVDGKSVFFHPWHTRVLDDEIRTFLERQGGG
jgi:hypothetical protein